jgi:hypothetical protein
MAQAVISRLLTAEALVRSHVNPCEICGFSPSTSVSPCQYHFTSALYIICMLRVSGQRFKVSKKKCFFGNRGGFGIAEHNTSLISQLNCLQMNATCFGLEFDHRRSCQHNNICKKTQYCICSRVDMPDDGLHPGQNIYDMI